MIAPTTPIPKTLAASIVRHPNEKANNNKMTDNLYSDIWENYTACWSNPNEIDRKAILSQKIDTTCVYTDPNMVTVGVDELTNYMAQFQQGFAGVKFVTTKFVVHHDQSLTHWDMVNAENVIVGNGISFGMFKDGKLIKMTGFF